MKTARKLFAMLMALSMILALAVTANAAQITIENSYDEALDQQLSDATVYTYYKILDAEIKTDGTVNEETGELETAGTVSYYVDSEAKANALTATGLFTAVAMVDGRYNVRLISKTPATTGEQIAEALKTAVDNGTFGRGTDFTSDGEKAEATNLDPGYYFIKSSLGTKLVAQTLSSVTIKEKNDYPTIDKKIVSGDALVEENTANIGDYVNYSVPVKIPASAAEKDIVVTDTMHKGLTLDKDSLANDKNISGLAFADGTSTDENYNVYTVTIPAASVSALAGQTVTLTYRAILNSNAVIAGDGTDNKVHLNYDRFVTKDESVTTKTFKFEVDKRAESTNGDKLAEVEFTLTRGSGDTLQYFVTKDGNSSVWTDTETKFTTAENANIIFEGLEPGTYTLTETKTVTGYNKLTAPVVVTIDANGTVTYTSSDQDNATNGSANADTTDGKNVITIVNLSGATLPSTGGIGTTIFTVVGATLMIGAAVLFVTKKRSIID